MAISTHTTEFAGFRVQDYDPEVGLDDPGTVCPRLRIYYTPVHERDEAPRRPSVGAVLAIVAVSILLWLWIGWWALVFLGFGLWVAFLDVERRLVAMATTDELLDDLFAEEDVEELRALVIGAWQNENDMSAEPVVERLVARAERLPNLEALFIGDITSEECEMSWIEQTDLAPLAEAFPKLRVLRARGGNNLRFRGLRHDSLERLVVETGGMWSETLSDLADARLPQLKELELWLGDPMYGFDGTVEDVRPVWQPSKFGRLETLALRNAPIADEIAIALAAEPEAVQRLKRLDLSMGTLTDDGAEALYHNPAVADLDSLDVHHHYMSEEWTDRLQGLSLQVDVSSPRGPVPPGDEADLYRYVAVSE